MGPVSAAGTQGRFVDEIAERTASMSDAELARLARLVLDQQASRARAAADPAALMDQAFAEGFDRKGVPSDPYMAPGGVVVCLGYRSGTAASHACAFVSADGEHKAWEHPSLIADEVRYVDGDQTKLRSVSLIPAVEGTRVTLVHARRSSGSSGCKRRRASSYEVADGVLSPVEAPPTASLPHR